MSSPIPLIYRLTFTYLEPILNLSGFYLYTFDIPKGQATYIPSAILPYNPATDVIYAQLSGCMLLIFFLQAVFLRYTKDPTAWRMINFALALYDVRILQGTYAHMVEHGRLDPLGWRHEDWAQVGFTAGIGALRVLCAAGFGMGGGKGRFVGGRGDKGRTA
ncbi:hypothetical protein GE09DRAFT_1062366 [Coniochaeta sp. 2T2.1]|nr:hypothetical protein GE09DRAFT_1062366 [Coniochaeta sp. 2T2.1]